ncbi:MAG: alpha/beta hydrolase [Elusimicrobia bacterium]|nr:alpha/beta hydrolase [Candidatus Obscuribacterium magneticum]
MPSWNLSIPTPTLKFSHNTLLFLVVLLVVFFFVRRSFVGLFFYPDNEDYGSPSYRRIPFEDVFFPGGKGRKLHGYFFRPEGRPRGTIIQCHGNAANITNHYTLMLFLGKAGYNVFVFDYGGFGQSEGSPSPDSIVGDAFSALAYVRSRPDVDKNRIALFGQSLGGAPAAAVTAREKNLRCLILEASFTTYREMALATSLGRLLFFIVPAFIPGTGPKQFLKDIVPRPLLIIHGETDPVVPVKFSRRLHELSPSNSRLVIIPGFSHLEGPEGYSDYSTAVLEFLENNLKGSLKGSSPPRRT